MYAGSLNSVFRFYKKSLRIFQRYHHTTFQNHLCSFHLTSSCVLNLSGLLGLMQCWLVNVYHLVITNRVQNLARDLEITSNTIMFISSKIIKICSKVLKMKHGQPDPRHANSTYQLRHEITVFWRKKITILLDL